MANLQVRNIPDGLHERLRRHARLNNRSMSAVVLTAVERELDRWEWQEHMASRPKTDLGVSARKAARGRTLRPLHGDGVSRYVVDASVAVEYLLKTPLGLAVADTIENATLASPELLDAEVLSVLRREVLNGRLEESRARMVVDDLLRWPVDRVCHRALAPLAWHYRHNVSAYDAFYVAAAYMRDFPLMTADGRLSRSPGLNVVVQHIHVA